MPQQTAHADFLLYFLNLCSLPLTQLQQSYLIQIRSGQFYIMDQLFDKTFYNQSLLTNTEIKQWNFKIIDKFPLKIWIEDGDHFFKKLWEIIDRSNRYVWVTTYAANNSPPADTTIYKLIQAAKRGVNVVLLIDNVQNWARPSLLKQLRMAGGVCKILNPQFQLESIYKYFTKDVWRRHHQKLIVSDNKALIGSSNIQQTYGGIKYGNKTFIDLNFYCENIALDSFRKHFLSLANFYNFVLQPKITNKQLQNQLNRQFPNSIFYNPKSYILAHNNRIQTREIQRYILNNIKLAKKQIKIIVPYFFNIASFNQALKQANQRGVKTEIITSRNREQLVFKYFGNNMFFREILKSGTDVYETKERFLHSKIYLFDGKGITFGSMNNDRWSWVMNNELNLIIQQEKDCEYANQYFQNMKKRTIKVKDNYVIDANCMPTISFWMNFLYLSQIVMGNYQNIQQDCIDNQLIYD